MINEIENFDYLNNAYLLNTPLSQNDNQSFSSSNLNLDTVNLSSENNTDVKRLFDASLNLPKTKKKTGKTLT